MTQEFKGTPEPWYPVEFAGYWRVFDQPFYEATDIMDAENVGEQCAKNNCHLAAAAPDLLEALQDLVNLKKWKDKHGKDEHYENSKEMVWLAARAAICKALNQEV